MASQTSFVFGVTALRMASTSQVRFFSAAMTFFAPTAMVAIG
ncbi:hypothetical protein ACVWXM_004601 [Bradyrhizobium sp. GM7.3]